MYGYIRYNSDELKMKDYRLFQSYYCGLCRHLQRRFGARGRLLLSYDLTFTAIFLDGLATTAPATAEARCPLRPFRKQTIAGVSDGIEKAADLSALMGYYKMEDHWRDEHSILGRGAMALYHKACRKAGERDPNLAAITSSHLTTFYEGEQPGRPLDELAHPFAALIGEALADKAEEEQKLHLYKIGYHCGRWIYFIDALDDLPADWKKGRFNPYVAALEAQGDDWFSFFKTVAHDVEANLYFSLEEICRAFDNLTFRRNGELIHNIFYLGVRNVTDSILALRKAGQDDKFANPLNLRTIFTHRDQKRALPPQETPEAR